MQIDTELSFADGVYDFKLNLPQLDELEKKCGPIGALMTRLMRGRHSLSEDVTVGTYNEAEWQVRDLVEVIRQGLIGGAHGMVDGQEVKVSHTRANELIQNYVLTQPLNEIWTLAFSILATRVIGFEPKKKAEPNTNRKAPKSRKVSSVKTVTPEQSLTA